MDELQAVEDLRKYISSLHLSGFTKIDRSHQALFVSDAVIRGENSEKIARLMKNTEYRIWQRNKLLCFDMSGKWYSSMIESEISFAENMSEKEPWQTILVLKSMIDHPKSQQTSSDDIQLLRECILAVLQGRSTVLQFITKLRVRFALDLKRNQINADRICALICLKSLQNQ